MHQDLKMERVQGEQLQSIVDLAHKIWPVCYRDILTEAQINYMLAKFYTLESLKDQAKNQIFYNVYSQKIEVGFFAFEHINSKEKTKLNKIYVDPNVAGNGIGQRMMEFVVSEAKKVGNTSIFLNVNKFNNAVHFYTHLGFKIIHEEIIDIGNGYVMDDFVMEKVI